MLKSFRTLICAALTSAALVGTVSAQSVESLAGTWKRTGGEETPTVGVYTLEVSGDRLVGSMSNPPAGFSCELSLSLEGEAVVGTATWREGVVDMQVETRWELTVEDADTLSGRCQWKVWAADGTVEQEGWDEYQLERVKRVGLAIDGEDADAPFGDPLPAPAMVYGGYEALGSGWTIRHALGTWKVEPASGPYEGVRIELTERGGILSGDVTLADGETCRLELGWDEGSRSLTGRSSWTEGADGEGWAPITFTRLPRINEGPTDRLAEIPTAGNEGPISGVYRRQDDGLYLRLQGDEASAEGDLVDADGQVLARIQLRQRNGVWRGTGNFDGVSTDWEYSITDEGLNGRAEFVDHLDGEVVTRAFSLRPFVKLKRLN